MPVDPVKSAPAHWQQSQRTTPPQQRLSAAPASPAEQDLQKTWWRHLGDPAIDRLMDAARFTSVEQAWARAEEAHAVEVARGASRGPTVVGGASTQRGLEQANGVQLVSRSGPFLRLDGDLDLWGRLQRLQAAAGRRSAQRDAEVEHAVFAAQTGLVSAVIRDRACQRLALWHAEDQQAGQTLLALHRARWQAGSLSAQAYSRHEMAAAAADANLAQTTGACAQQRESIRALTGLAPQDLDAVLRLPAAPMPALVQLAPMAPATLLLRHPHIRAAAAAADAAYEEEVAAEAARRPSASLSALLGHQWIRWLGRTGELDPWSLGLSVAMPLWDGGAVQAQEHMAHARTLLAVAALEQTLRQTIEEVESALIRLTAAKHQARAAMQHVAAAKRGWTASLLAADAGRLNAMDREEADRQWRAAQQGLVIAQRDEALAWTELVKAAGPGLTQTHTAP